MNYTSCVWVLNQCKFLGRLYLGLHFSSWLLSRKENENCTYPAETRWKLLSIKLLLHFLLLVSVVDPPWLNDRWPPTLYHFSSNITKGSWVETRKVTHPLPSWAKQTLLGETGDLRNQISLGTKEIWNMFSTDWCIRTHGVILLSLSCQQHKLPNCGILCR